MNSLPNNIKKSLNSRASNGHLRALKPRDLTQVDFMSNDYLGLANVPFENGLSSGSTGSRLISGTSQTHLNVENNLARYYHAEASLVFNSGYSANLGLFSSIGSKRDLYLYDELIHASIREGIRASVATSFKFKHNDIIDLKSRLNRLGYKYESVFVVVESIYSMDGDAAPLRELCSLEGIYLIVDEAHALGYYKSGMVCEMGLENEVFARVMTFGKAVGFHGAVVLGSDYLKSFLINYAKAFIYTTALSESDMQEIWDRHLFIKDGEKTEVLRNRVECYLNSVDDKLGFSKNSSSIQTLVIGDVERVKRMEFELSQKGYALKAILSPTVKKGEERLRICLHTYNSNQEIKELIKLLEEYA
ncbi:MAG: aminotransferase class I/II-fold pyridoxal phosphate-dependent enzyme [Flavobacteriaceae bacterium]